MKTQRVVCTRPHAQNQAWAQKLKEQGYTILQAPLLELSAVTDATQLQAIKNHIMQLDQYRCIIFVSQNAIQHGFEWIENYWPQLPTGINWLAVGKKSGELLQQRLGNLTKVHAATNLMTSEDLLSLPVLQHVHDHKILICRGVGGRPTLADELLQRGAKVDLCELYLRKKPNNIEGIYSQFNLNKNDVLPVFSGETLDNFIQMASQFKTNSWQDITLIVPSQRVANAAKEAGFNTILTAKNANEDSMLQCLKEYFPNKHSFSEPIQPSIIDS